jgi:hypothetical protein
MFTTLLGLGFSARKAQTVVLRSSSSTRVAAQGQGTNADLKH